MGFRGDIYLFRQSLVLLANCMQSIATGCILAFPAVLNSAILSPNSTDIHATQDQASWITSVYGFVGILGFCILPFVMQNYGRKVTNIITNVTNGTGFVMLALAENVTTLYAARGIQGLSLCGLYLANVFMAEYVHPSRRGYFITLKLGAVAFGSFSCHSLVLVCSWREIAAIAIIPNILGLILTLPWPESPAFLAMKGRYEDCEKSFNFLNGTTPDNRKDLEDLISAQVEQKQKEVQDEEYTNLSKICKKIVRKDFTMPFFITIFLTVIVDSGGRYYNLAYIVQIVGEITGDNSVGIYCSMGVDILTIIACWTSSYVITKLTRRTILFAFGYLSVVLMFSIRFIVYYKLNDFSYYVVWLILCIILFNSFIVHIGVIPVCFTVTGEVFPLEHRGSGFAATGIGFTLLYGITMKCTPIMMEKTGIEGTYGIFGLCSVISLIILKFILIETKDKTLQEIEDEMKGINHTKKADIHEKESLVLA